MVGMGLTDHHHIKIAMEENALECPLGSNGVALQQKNIYYNQKNRCNNITLIAIVYVKCCNKIWGNKFVLQKISLQ